MALQQSAAVLGTAPFISADLTQLYSRQEIDSELWVEPTFEASAGETAGPRSVEVLLLALPATHSISVLSTAPMDRVIPRIEVLNVFEVSGTRSQTNASLHRMGPWWPYFQSNSCPTWRSA